MQTAENEGRGTRFVALTAKLEINAQSSAQDWKQASLEVQSLKEERSRKLRSDRWCSSEVQEVPR